jgi:hypothetical protein
MPNGVMVFSIWDTVDPVWIHPLTFCFTRPSGQRRDLHGFQHHIYGALRVPQAMMWIIYSLILLSVYASYLAAWPPQVWGLTRSDGEHGEIIESKKKIRKSLDCSARPFSFLPCLSAYSLFWGGFEQYRNFIFPLSKPFFFVISNAFIINPSFNHPFRIV